LRCRISSGQQASPLDVEGARFILGLESGGVTLLSFSLQVSSLIRCQASKNLNIEYHLNGHDLTGDAYNIEGFTDKTGRKLLKLLLLSLLNTDCEMSAIGAMNDKISGKQRWSKRENKVIEGDKNSRIMFKKYCSDNKVDFYNLIYKFKMKHHIIKHEFFKLRGLKLQRIDSEINSRITMEFVKLGKPLLSLHNSMICIETDRQLLKKCMIKYHKEVIKIKFKIDEDNIVE
jgi:hypothetical protein